MGAKPKQAKQSETADEAYAIQCFRNGERKFTHVLTKEEARNFLVAAQNLAKHLTTEYML